jgi:hypothetical protein
MKSHWVFHKGTRIFISDFSNYGSDAAGVRQECRDVVELLKKESFHSVLAVTTVEGTFANEEIIRALVDLVPQTNQYIKRRAVVGVSGFRRHFLDVFGKVVGNLTFSTFETMPEALDWLVS